MKALLWQLEATPLRESYGRVFSGLGVLSDGVVVVVGGDTWRESNGRVSSIPGALSEGGVCRHDLWYVA